MVAHKAQNTWKCKPVIFGKAMFQVNSVYQNGVPILFVDPTMTYNWIRGGGGGRFEKFEHRKSGTSGKLCV